MPKGLGRSRGAGTVNTVLPINLSALRLRQEQFLQAHVCKQRELRKHRVALEFDRFLRSISASTRNWSQATDQNMVDGMCSLDTQGEGTTVAVHTPMCSGFGSKICGCHAQAPPGVSDGIMLSAPSGKGIILNHEAAFPRYLGKAPNRSH